jgi:hemolysin activation/secretion protein
VLTSGLNAGQTTAQTINPEKAEDASLETAGALIRTWRLEVKENSEFSIASKDSQDSRESNSTAHSSSPFQTKSFVESVVSPLERTWDISQGIDSLTSGRAGTRFEEKKEEPIQQVASQANIPTTPSPAQIAQVPNPVAQQPTIPDTRPVPNIQGVPIPPQNLPRQPDRTQPPSQEPISPPPPTPLPPPEQLLESPSSIPPNPQAIPGKVPENIVVDRFEFEGNTAISSEELAAVTAPFTKKPISFAELFQARAAVTDLYLKRGYITSGALIPPQQLQGGVVKIQVIEGGLEAINVRGTQRLNPEYVRSRLRIATDKPLNRDRLLEALQLLQLNPLIQNISAELAAGTEPGANLLDVQVTEAKTFNVQIGLDNNRAPSVGTFRRRVQINQANLFGLGDGLNLGYSNTDGSNSIDLGYTLPINPRNGTLRFSYGITKSNVVEPPFDRIDIRSNSNYYELSLRQPLLQTPSQELALGLTATRQETDTSVLEIPFPLSAGADDRGRTRISALRFFQEWTKRTSREVIAARSQFSVGLDVLNATINKEAPDSRFFSWRGQAQWVRLLAPETLLLLRADVQLADRALVPLEQFGLGGQESVRGYRQDILLQDNGALASAEVRIPIVRIPQWNALLQVAPFLDFGSAWTSSGNQNPDPNILVSTGLGLQLQLGDRVSVRLDYGIPLVSVSSRKRSWQENGFYFSIVATPFTF